MGFAKIKIITNCTVKLFRCLFYSFPKPQSVASKLSFREKPISSKVPLKVVTVFTNGSGKTHKSVITWQNQTIKEWESDIQTLEGSHQVVALAAVVRAF